MPKKSIVEVRFTIGVPKGGAKGSIRARIRSGGKEYRFSTGESVPVAAWNPKRGRAKVSLKERDFTPLNNRLDAVERAMITAWNKYRGQFTSKTFRDYVKKVLNDEGTGGEGFGAVDFMELFNKEPKAAEERFKELGECSREMILDFIRGLQSSPKLKNIALGRRENGIPFMDFIPVLLERRKKAKGAKWGTVKVLFSWYVHLSAYFHMHDELDYDDITNNFRWRDSFCEFLFSPQEFTFPFKKGYDLFQKCGTAQMLFPFDEAGNYQYRKEPLSINYVQKGIEVVMQYVNEARRDGQTKAFFHKGFNIKKERTNKIVLYFDEWERIATTDLQGDRRLEATRIRAFVGGFTGMREGDWDKFSPELIKVFDNEKMLDVFTQKTGEPVAIPFLPVFEEILEGVRYKIPTMWSQDFNENFKELCRVCGIDEEVEWIDTAGGTRKVKRVPKWQVVTSHTCRRSFATNFTLPPVSLSKTVVMQITGHTTEKMFNAYCNYSKQLNAAMVSKSFQRQRAHWLYALKKEAG